MVDGGAGDGQQEQVVYLNVLVMQEALLRGLRQQASENAGEHPWGFRVLQGLLPEAVRQALEDAPGTAAGAGGATELLPALTELLPANLASLGVEARCEEVFRRGSLVVYRVVVASLDTDSLQGQRGGFGLFCRCVDSSLHHEDRVSEDDMRLLLEVLPQKLTANLAHKGSRVEVIAKSTQDQRVYFETALQGPSVLKDLRACQVPSACAIS